MSLTFHAESFRDDFTFRNSQAGIRRFPFPFDRDDYMYAVNIEPHVTGAPGSVFENLIDVDEHYVAELQDRALVLQRDPLRCQSLPHMAQAGWDVLELLMTHHAQGYPDHFALHRDGDHWRWINRPLGIDDRFIFGRAATLPRPPFEYITRQAQGDFVVLDQREDNLWMDAGMVTTQADWSLDFDIGMNFMEWHAPVPLAHQLGIFERALKFMMSLRQGAPTRRYNWTMTINPRLDTSPETYPEWGPDRMSVTPDTVGAKVHLRVEVQSFWRLPRSNAVLFPIRCYLLRLEDLVTVPQWARQMHRVLRDLPAELADYKGLSRWRPLAIDYLARFDDGQQTSPGPRSD